MIIATNCIYIVSKFCKLSVINYTVENIDCVIKTLFSKLSDSCFGIPQACLLLGLALNLQHPHSRAEVLPLDHQVCSVKRGRLKSGSTATVLSSLGMHGVVLLVNTPALAFGGSWFESHNLCPIPMAGLRNY